VKQSIVVYRGPSMLDGAPIVVLVSTGSSNVKTGPMLQTWIMRADMNPSEASKQGKDASVCGSCPRRHSLGGDCYVQIVHAPRSTWASWDSKDAPGENWTDAPQILALQQDAQTHGLRLGSYGDPMAVPAHVWQDLIAALQPRSVVGYTHQWERELFHVPGGELLHRYSADHVAWFRDHVMASCDNVTEATRARELGWRFFLATPEGSPVPERTIQCPATRDVNPLTCRTCGICNGAGRGVGKASVYLVEHGMRSQSKAKRSPALAVL
jgi:hypothetical protein